MCISSKEVHLRKASRSMRLSVLANLRCCSWEQRAKVPPRISLISVREMSTVCSLSQRSKAAGPIQQKSAGRVSISSPASEKQPSGMTRFGSCGWGICSPFQIDCLQSTAFFKGSSVEACLRRKLIACSVWVTYPGKRVALLKYPTPEMFAPWGSDCVEHITSPESSVFQAY